MVSRVFVVLAAALFVLSAALASLAGPLVPLFVGLQEVDRDLLSWLNSHSSSWVQQWMLFPLLLRPVWLLPLSLGVVSLGIAASLNSVRGTPLRRKS